MAEPGNKRISLSHQAALLGINRTSIYRPPRGPVWAEIDLEDLRMID
jgi:predicted transcriptional regulator